MYINMFALQKRRDTIIHLILLKDWVLHNNGPNVLASYNAGIYTCQPELAAYVSCER